MSYYVRYHPEAEAELKEASTYLDSESPGLGDFFLDDVQDSLDLILFSPEISPVIQANVRQNILRKFPYSLIYTIVSFEIRILAVAHQRRRPFYWKERQRIHDSFR
jgi:plasmid stabilization system protein ParE